MPCWEKTNTKSFADVTVNEGIGTYNWCFVLLGCIKTNYRFDYAKSGRILTQINRIN
jgi:hypothetical protein